MSNISSSNVRQRSNCYFYYISDPRCPVHFKQDLQNCHTARLAAIQLPLYRAVNAVPSKVVVQQVQASLAVQKHAPARGDSLDTERILAFYSVHSLPTAAKGCEAT